MSHQHPLDGTVTPWSPVLSRACDLTRHPGVDGATLQLRFSIKMNKRKRVALDKRRKKKRKVKARAQTTASR